VAVRQKRRTIIQGDRKVPLSSDWADTGSSTGAGDFGDESSSSVPSGDPIILREINKFKFKDFK